MNGKPSTRARSAAKPAKAASTKTPAKKELSLNEKQVLVGDYPKILDLRKYTFENKTFLHLSEEFELAEAEGRPPQPNISVSGSDSVEVIHFPGYGYDYAVVEHLPNLKELHVHEGEWGGGGPTWLICQNLPRLEKIVIDGTDVRWLQLENVAVLNSIDVSGCEKLDYFSIKSAPKLKVINVDGCIKLRKVLDLNPAAQRRLGIARQIKAVQKSSRRDQKIYDNMTITDIDMVLANINYGAKLATRKGLFPENEFCYGREDDPKFKSFSFELLRPLEYVYTGGTGETYAYDFLCHDYSRSGHGISSSEGNSNQEDCLDRALHYMINLGLALPSIDELKQKRRKTSSINGFEKIYTKMSVLVLDFLNQLIAEEKGRSRRPK